MKNAYKLIGLFLIMVCSPLSHGQLPQQSILIYKSAKEALPNLYYPDYILLKRPQGSTSLQGTFESICVRRLNSDFGKWYMSNDTLYLITYAYANSDFYTSIKEEAEILKGFGMNVTNADTTTYLVQGDSLNQPHTGTWFMTYILDN